MVNNVVRKPLSMNKIRIFSVSAVILSVLILSAAYATTSTTATISVSGTTPVGAVALGYNHPSWTPATNSGGSITAGNLYNVTVPANTISLVTIYLTNPTSLSADYEYLNMNISYGNGVSSGQFTPTYSGAILSLSNGYVQFEISAGASAENYTVGIAGGSFYCLSTTATGGSLNPSFYITVEAV